MSKQDYYYEFATKINRLKDFVRQMNEELKIQEKRIEEVLSENKEELTNENERRSN